MKTHLKLLFAFIVLSFLVVSCSIEKRLYRPGFHTSTNKNIKDIRKNSLDEYTEISNSNQDNKDIRISSIDESKKLNNVKKEESIIIASTEDNFTHFITENNEILFSFHPKNKHNQLKQEEFKAYIRPKAYSNKEQKKDDIPLVWAIVFLASTLFGIVKMLLTIGKYPYQKISIEDIKAKRKELGLPEESTTEETEKAWSLLNESTANWYTYTDESGEELMKPRRRKHIKEAAAKLKAVQEMLPTDPEVLERMDVIGFYTNKMNIRSFAGSTPLLIIAIGALIVLALLSTQPFFPALLSLWWLMASIVFYIFASRAPQYLIDRRLDNFGGFNITSSFIGGFMSIFLSTPTTETVKYTYTDGSEEVVEELNFGKIFLLILMACVYLFLGMIIHLFGLLNFFRNYVFYF